MTLHIQDPSDQTTHYLIDALRSACEGATRGAGAFAFLSAGGVRLFLGDKIFKEFEAAGGKFDLIAGVDAVTDSKAIVAVEDALHAMPGLTAKVHFSTENRSIFHPKFAWFEKKNGGVLITGSGNLTGGGLRMNFEAFTASTLNKTEMKAVISTWENYRARCAVQLLEIDDERVKDRVLANGRLTAAIKLIPNIGREEKEPGVMLPQEPPGPAIQPENLQVDALPSVQDNTTILLAEIPKSGNRWKQANFSKDVFIDFFEASMEEPRTAFFFSVSEAGLVGHQEVRPAVVVVSRNYRFELDAASGLAYPANGKPIGIFVRVAARTFTYMLLLPENQAHLILNKILDAKIKPSSGMRRVILEAHEVKAAWPNSPLWGQLTI